MFTKKILSQIFVKISSPSGDPSKLSSTKARYSSAFLLGFLFLIFCSCSTTKQVQTVPVETLRKDTVYLSNIQYDSIYIHQERNVLPLPDSIHLPFNGEDGRGLYIKEKSIEYRYKLLRDTIKVVRIDTIPYEVKIVETKEVKYTPPWILYLAWAGGLSFLLLIARMKKVFEIHKPTS